MSYNVINKNNIDHLLFEVAKEYKKIAKKHATPVNMAIVGGCSIVINYSFREASSDIDSVIYGNSVFNEAIKNVARANNLPDNWINSDFEKTESYSSKLFFYAKRYKKFYDILDVYTVNEEYLIAMKLVSFRAYKNDKSDIIGILCDMYNNQKEISIDRIYEAINNLYGKISISDDADNFIKQQINNNYFLESLNKIRDSEKSIGDIVKSKSKTIKNQSDLVSIIRKTNEIALNKHIENEIGDHGSLRSNVIEYSITLKKKYKNQNVYTNYEEFLNNELKDDYGIFVLLLNEFNPEK